MTTSNIILCRQNRNSITCTLKNMEKAFTSVNPEADFCTFLDEYLQWNVSFSEFNQSIEESYNCSKSSTRRNLHHFFECLKWVDRPKNCSQNQTAANDNRKTFREIYFVFMVLGIISLIGNLTVIFIETRTLIQKHSMPKEKKIYKALVLNLSISDLLMGIYLTFFPMTNKFFEDIPELCKFFGVISVLSSEISVTVLVLICLYRWVGIAYPYKKIKLTVLKTAIPLMWITWLIVALIPALSVDLIGLIFTHGIQFLNQSMDNIKFDKMLKLFKLISNEASNNNIRQVIPVFKKLADFNSKDLLYTSMKHLKLLKDDDPNYRYLNYYSNHTLCTLRTFINSPFSDQYYALSILLYNFLAFVFIFIACIVIFKNLTKNAKNVKQNGRTVSEQILSENRKIYRRIFLVIVTDFLCWIPICVIAFNFYFQKCHTKLSKSIMFWVVLILMPINSLINPYLYSWHVWKKILKKCKNCFVKN